MKSEGEGFRISDSGIEPIGANSREKPRSTGFGDKKKVVFLVALLAVGGGVAAYQFLKGGSPQVAVATPAKPPGAGAMDPMAGVGAEAAAATTALATPADSDDGISVTRVEQLVKEFEGYVSARQTPLKNLQANPFTVCPVKVKPVEGRPLTQSNAAYEEVSARRQKIREAAGGLVLGSVMVAADRRMAIINNKVCTVGSRVKGFVVEAIELDLVRVSADGETVDLRLVKKQAQQPD
jgi:hypothetical protein